MWSDWAIERIIISIEQKLTESLTKGNIEKKTMSEPLNRKMEACLATIDRMYQFVERDEFIQASKAELTERKNSTRQAFDQYRKEHLDWKDLSDEDWARSLNRFNEVEERAIRTIARCQERINHLAKVPERSSVETSSEQIESMNNEMETLRAKATEREAKLQAMTKKLDSIMGEMEADFEKREAEIQAQHDLKIGDITARESSLLERLERAEREKQMSEKKLQEQLKTANEQLKSMDLEMQTQKDNFVMNEVTYRAQIDGLKKQCDELASELRNMRANTTESSTSSGAAGQDQPVTQQAKAEICLEKFDGEFQKWPEWKIKYDELVHLNADLSVSEKVRKLMSSMSGSAKAMFDHWHKTGANYEDMYRLFNDTFSNKFKFTMQTLDALERYKPGNSSEIEEVNSLVTAAERIGNNLMAAECPTAQWEAQAVRAIIARMPAKTQKEWDRVFVGTDMPSFNDVINFMKRQAKELMSTSNTSGSTKERQAGRATSGKSRPYSRSTTTQERLNTGATQRNSNAQTTGELVGGCHNCQEQHVIRRCPELERLSKQQKERRIKQLNLCMNCLSPYHSVGSLSCTGGRCKGGFLHNSILCDEICQEAAQRNSAKENPSEFRDSQPPKNSQYDNEWDN